MVHKRSSRRLATSVDVAREAGVSQSTVSYVLNGQRSITPETQERVRAAIKRLGYQPNSRAQALASRRTNVIGVLLPYREGLDHEVNFNFLVNIATAARKRDFDILVITDDEGPRGLERIKGTAMCDAVIIMDIGAHDDRLPVASSLDLPVVLIGVPEEAYGLHCVDLDFKAAGGLGVGELVASGARHIGVLTPPEEDVRREVSFVGRFSTGAQTAAMRHGVRLSFKAAGATFAGAKDALQKLLGLGAPIDALLVQSSNAVGATMQAVMSLGIQPGPGFPIVAVCEDGAAERQFVPLTSIRLEPQTVSELAVATLVEVLRGEVSERESVALLEPALIRRRSSRP